jgi:hypothetical protein
VGDELTRPFRDATEQRQASESHGRVYVCGAGCTCVTARHPSPFAGAAKGLLLRVCAYVCGAEGWVYLRDGATPQPVRRCREGAAASSTSSTSPASPTCSDAKVVNRTLERSGLGTGRQRMVLERCSSRKRPR